MNTSMHSKSPITLAILSLLNIYKYCGIIKIHGVQFLWISKILQVRGNVILCIFLNLQKEI